MAANFLGFFGKNKEVPSGQQAPPPPVAVPPSSNPALGKTPAIVTRKKVTQRLSLKGIQPPSSASSSQKIQLPGVAPSPVAAPPVQTSASLDIPFAIILQAIPGEYLTAGLGDLLAQPEASTEIALPLAQILPMLPSGKIEFSVQEIVSYIPPGFVHGPEVLGEAAGNTFTLPLFQVASRIPSDAMILRTDQRPIDASVMNMSDPFSPEMLGMARAAAAAAAEAAEAGAAPEIPAAEEVPVPEPEPVYEPAPEPVQEEIAEVPAATPGIDWGQALAEAAPEVEASQEESVPQLTEEPAATASEPDLSFAHSEEFRRFAAQMEQAAAERAAGEEAAAEETVPVEIPPEEVPVEGSPESMMVEQVEWKVPPPPPGVIFGKTPSLESALAAPTRPLNIPPPKVFQSGTPAFGFREALQGLQTPTPEVVPPAPPPAVEPVLFQAKDHPPQHRLHGAKLPVSINVLLGLSEEQEIGLRDVVEQVRRWPGMAGCIIAGKDGLPITSVTDDRVYAQSLSAFAPKILGRVNELFTDLGTEEADEIHVPKPGVSTYIFRYRDIYFIVLFRQATLPETYSVLIKEILKQIASG